MTIAGGLPLLAALWLVLSGLCSLTVLGDILGGHSQRMKIMNVVWPITPLYAGPFGLWAYYTIGRSTVERPTGAAKRPSWQSVVTGVSHCAAGCTLGDILGDALAYSAGWKIAGMTLWPRILAEFGCAYLIGIVFQYFSIVPMRHLTPINGIKAAIKADTFSIVAYEAGMFVWMLLARFVIFRHELSPTGAVYWLMMQIAMLVGFATAYPMNRWLIIKGWKEAM
jgi:hypothetical protein